MANATWQDVRESTESTLVTMLVLRSLLSSNDALLTVDTLRDWLQRKIDADEVNQ